MSDRRVAFVTGAGRGIGRAIATAFGSAGYAVAVGSPTASRNESVAQSIRDAGARALPVVLDVTNENSVRAGLQATVAALGHIDLLVTTPE